MIAAVIFAIAPVRVSLAQTPIPASVPKVGKALPPCPAGVTPIAWSEFIKTPVGAMGLEMTDKIQSLHGKKVRLLGYMVQRDAPVPGVLLLTPYRINIEEQEAGFADLPPQTVRVLIPQCAKQIMAYTPRPLLLTGTLSVGQQSDADEVASQSRSLFRLTLDAPTPKPLAPKKTPRRGVSARFMPTNAPSRENRLEK